MNDWAQSYGLWGLFVSAFVSSTLAPGGSEAVLAYLAHEGRTSPARLLGFATVGNSLGALTTWGLGWLLARRHGSALVLSPERHKSVEHVKRWGIPLLLLSWLPLVGDGFCFAAGWLRLPFWSSVVAITAGKALRYAGILAAVS
jgi:membrane protein YqaA with SNARE-associated domain